MRDALGLDEMSSGLSHCCHRDDSLMKLGTNFEPWLSVVIPTYNYASRLPGAVESVLQQLPIDCELLVVDDGSTDDTECVVAGLLAEHAGRLRYLRKENGGPASARNLGIRSTRGRYLLFLDADDQLCPGILVALREHVGRYQDSVLVIGGHWSLAEDGQRDLHAPGVLSASPHERLRDYLLEKRLSMMPSACLFRRDAFVLGNFPEHMRNTEDIPVFAQLLANGACSLIDQPVALMNRHADSLRHNLQYATSVGLGLVDEVFSSQRMPTQFQDLRKPFLAQRCLSLFRTFYAASDYANAVLFYRQALRADWRVIGRFSYTRKVLRMLLARSAR